MNRSILLSTIIFSLAGAVGPVSAGPGAPGHADGGFSAGEPGDAKKPARLVQITMQEGSGKMMYFPARLDIKRGEQVKFVVRNGGQLDHEFVLATTAENVKHAAEMKKNPEMEHGDPNAKRVSPKNAGEIVWKFSKAGEFEYGCLIPGHREAGMIGTIVVK